MKKEFKGDWMMQSVDDGDLYHLMEGVDSSFKDFPGDEMDGDDEADELSISEFGGMDDETDSKQNTNSKRSKVISKEEACELVAKMRGNEALMEDYRIQLAKLCGCDEKTLPLNHLIFDTFVKKSIQDEAKLAQAKQIVQAFCNAYHEREMAVQVFCDKLTPYANKIINAYYKTFTQAHMDDLREHALVGIFEGLQKYDPEKSLPTTFFKFYIKHELTRYTSMHTGMTIHYTNKAKIIKAAIERLTKAGKEVTVTALSEITNLKANEISKLLRMDEARINVHFDSDEKLEMNITRSVKSPESIMMEKAGIELLHEALQKLSESEREAIILNLGLRDDQTRTYKEVAAALHVTADKARRLCVQAKKHLADDKDLKREFGRTTRIEVEMRAGRVATIDPREGSETMREIMELLDD